MKSLPNILTGLRLVLSLLVFLILVLLGGAVPFVRPPMEPLSSALLITALVFFVVAAVTDFFDGWLARRYNATSLTGAILDPIADKILVCGGLLGLLCLGAKEIAFPAGLILFREFSVSAMREVLAPRGIKLPVTFLAKTKTTVQLVAIIAIMAAPMIGVLLPARTELAQAMTIRTLMMSGFVLLWLAALITVWTGVEYALAARRALQAPAELA